MPLPEQILERLKPDAVAAANRSYSPYSQFPVGAAVVDGAGRVHAGCNVENASLGLTQCAERNALAAAIAAGVAPGSLRALLIYTPGPQAHVPCGACRQVMHELMAPDSLVVSCCDGDAVRSWRRQDYLPDPFTPEALTREPAAER